MTTNREKMYKTNGMVRKWLIENGFNSIYFFPHLRYSKDYHIENMGFDGLAIRGDKFCFFQCKTNCKPTRLEQEKYTELEKRYDIKCLWFNRIKSNLEVY